MGYTNIPLGGTLVLMENTAYTVTGMSCSHCENAVREEVTALAEVESVTVSATDGQLTVHPSAGAHIDPESVIAAVAEAGYTAQPAP